jgi:hypothetical protein
MTNNENNITDRDRYIRFSEDWRFQHNTLQRKKREVKGALAEIAKRPGVKITYYKEGKGG